VAGTRCFHDGVLMSYLLTCSRVYSGVLADSIQSLRTMGLIIRLARIRSGCIVMVATCYGVLDAGPTLVRAIVRNEFCAGDILVGVCGSYPLERKCCPSLLTTQFLMDTQHDAFRDAHGAIAALIPRLRPFDLQYARFGCKDRPHELRTRSPEFGHLTRFVVLL
jgi:hypothetical protein